MSGTSNVESRRQSQPNGGGGNGRNDWLQRAFSFSSSLFSLLVFSCAPSPDVASGASPFSDFVALEFWNILMEHMRGVIFFFVYVLVAVECRNIECQKMAQGQSKRRE